MQVTINVPEELVEQARTRGVAVEAYVEKMITRQAQQLPKKYDAKSVGEAIDRILEFRKNHTLGGIQIKDLINEGRKY